MGDELGSATDIDRLFVSSGRSTLVFALVGNDDFWSCHVLDFRAKYRQKKGSFEFFLDISARSSRIPTPFGPAQKKEKGPRLSASSFQVMICSGSRALTLGSFIRFLAGPVRSLFHA